MFSGYKQSQSFTSDVLTAIEKHLGRNLFDELDDFDEGDLHLLVPVSSSTPGEIYRAKCV
ncbi:hypothetical protein ACHAWF_015113 [Thalassiosira exigua]